MSLKKDAKLFWIYLITSCNHAGIIELNEPLIKLQTGIGNLETVIKELDNRLVTLNDDYIFMPKFIEYQYPKFPNSKVKAQKSVIDILIRYDLWDIEKQTLTKGLGNCYVYGNGYVYGSDKEKKPNKIELTKQFYADQLKESDNNDDYEKLIRWLYGDNELKRELTHVLKMKEQVSFKQLASLKKSYDETGKSIKSMLVDLETWLMKNPTAKNTTVTGTITGWAKRK